MKIEDYTMKSIKMQRKLKAVLNIWRVLLYLIQVKYIIYLDEYVNSLNPFDVFEKVFGSSNVFKFDEQSEEDSLFCNENFENILDDNSFDLSSSLGETQKDNDCDYFRTSDSEYSGSISVCRQYELFCTLEEINSGCVKKVKIKRINEVHKSMKNEETKVYEIYIKPGCSEGREFLFKGYLSIYSVEEEIYISIGSQVILK